MPGNSFRMAIWLLRVLCTFKLWKFSGIPDEFTVVNQVYSGFGQVRVIGRLKSIEMLCIHFGGPVAPGKFTFKIDTHFGNHRFTVFADAAMTMEVIRFSFPSVLRAPMGS